MFREAAVRNILIFLRTSARRCQCTFNEIAKSFLKGRLLQPIPGPRCTSGRVASVLCKRDNYLRVAGEHKESTAREPREIKS